MDPLQEQRLARFFQFSEDVEQNPWILDRYPQFVPFFETLRERLLIIKNSKQMLEECKNVDSLKEDLVNLASNYCRKITSFALLEDITELQGMCFSPKELIKLDEGSLVEVCQQIVCKSSVYLSDLVDYGITDDALDMLRDLTDKFKSTLNHIGVSNNLIDQNFNEVSMMFSEHKEVLDFVKEPGNSL